MSLLFSITLNAVYSINKKYITTLTERERGKRRNQHKNMLFVA
jgi:hypothetical protein